jgi:single-stranded-DNA-specific exonuclease
MPQVHGTKYIWHLSDVAEITTLEVAARYNLSLPIARTLISRGYTQQASIENYLFGSAQQDVGNPALLYQAPQAVERIIQAIERKEKILIAGDYDVDGMTASALMMACLKPLHDAVNFFLPHRVKDGYGLSVRTIERAAKNGYNVVITVDNGITAFEPAQKAKELGIDLIITDHHRVQDKVPEAYAVVNPNQPACVYPYKYLAGVGVIFKVLSLLYERLGKPMPNKAYELLLLGTVADVVPLTGENRYWVRHGLRHVSECESLSFRTLKQNGKVVHKPYLSSLDVGFCIAPQLNALGRLEDPRQGVNFLLDSDPEHVAAIGTMLVELNQMRKEIEQSVLTEIVTQINDQVINLNTQRIIIASSDAWPPGVIGLVASRLVSTYGRPALLFHRTSDGIAKGSCRSIANFNMFEVLSSCRDLLITFGGHAQAAGLSLPIDALPELKARLERAAHEQLKPEDFEQKIMIDSVALLSDFTKKFVDDLQHLEPFGHQNPEPVFVVRNVSLVQSPMLLKEKHVKALIFADGIIKPIIFFNRPDIYDLLCQHQQGMFDIAAHVKENFWNDRVSLELTGVDVALAGAQL